MNVRNLNNSSSLDRSAMSDLEGGMRFVWRRIRKVKCIFGVKVVYYIWKMVPVCGCRGRRRRNRC